MSYGMQQPGPYGPGPQNGYQQGGQQQQYYQQQAGGPGGYDQKYNGGGPMPLAPNGYEGERFKPAKVRLRDPIFLILWLVVFGGFVGLSVYCLREYSISGVQGGIGDSTGGSSGTLNQHTAILLTLSCAVALVFSILYLILVRVATRFILELTLILSVIFNIGYAVYLWIEKFWSAAIIFTLFAILSVVSYFFMRSRIPLTRLLLKTVIDATKSHPSVYFWALLGTVIQAFFSIWTAWTLVSVYQRFSPSGAASSTGGNTGSGAVTGLIVFIGVAYYWTSELIKAVFFTTIAGTFGAWYYALPGDKARGASIKSFGRAISLSLGSLAFGSLIIALLDLLRAVLSIVQSSEAAGGDMVGAAIACVANCLLGCVQWAVELFNKYAYINIALYGNSYIKAAKETWRLVKDRGIDAIAQDCLTGIVFSFGSVIVGVITGIFAYVYLKRTDPTYINDQSSYISVILLVAVAMGIQICLSLGDGAINSGTSTLFVALAEDPYILQQKNPELFEMIRRTYPRVMQAVA